MLLFCWLSEMTFLQIDKKVLMTNALITDKLYDEKRGDIIILQGFL